MKTPRASIIIPTHDRPDRLRRAIASAFAASKDVEVIVVDDASADETAQLCASIAGIKYVRAERNQGVAGARNLGLVASRGEFISFLDDDDLRLPNSLDDQIEALSRSPAAMLCYAQAIPEDQTGKQGPPFPDACRQGDIFWDLLKGNFIPCGSVVFRRRCISSAGLLDDSISRIDDWDFWLRVTELFPVIGLKTPVLVWRAPARNSRQGSSETVEVIELAIKHFRRNCRRMPRVARASRRQRQQSWRAFSMNLADHLAWETFRSLCAADFSRAWVCARTLFKLHPGVLVHLTWRWTRASTIKTFIAGQHEPEGMKIRFKEIRSIPDT
ncbi:MAG TPA: glycosyltransferase family 2 protein [Pyrinomonadaceae bacterium]|nr:glycosyltransferase family 2 protein [Pyrinomonadaceae bacterium]